MILGALAWAGARAQWVLAFGVIAALLIPGPGALLQGTLAFWVTLLYALSMSRIDLLGVVRRAMGPRRMARNLVISALLVGVMPAGAWALATKLGLPQSHVDSLVYTFAAPALGSAAAFCLILGFDAAFAIELTVLSSLAAPITMPAVARLLLGEAMPIDAADMAWRLALVIGIGSVGAVMARRLLGPARIDRHGVSLDGLPAIILVVFLFPLFEGLLQTMIQSPGFTLGLLGMAILANLGVQIAAFPAIRKAAGTSTGGAAALIMGNRNAALALASVPGDAVFALFVALYQFPMYFTPLVMRRIARQ
ncbi:MAG: hypothetical protein AAF674_06960 [Pseudomonadota bacterium]